MRRINQSLAVTIILFAALMIGACGPSDPPPSTPSSSEDVRLTATPVPPTATRIPPTAAPVPPTATPVLHPLRDADKGGACSISGKGIGDARYYGIVLYGPNDPNKFRAETRFDASGNYGFSGLPDGHYWVKAEAKVDAPLPSPQEIDCMGGAITNVDFELK
jgi:hypothetical protein